MTDAEKIKIMREALWAIVAEPIVYKSISSDQIERMQRIASDALQATNEFPPIEGLVP